MTSLSDVMISGLTRLGQLNISKATGGSTTTIIDTTLDTDTFNEDDAFKNGFAVVIRDAGGASAAPEKEFARISAFVASTQTFTLDTALTVAVAAGDQYGFTNPQFTLQQMIRLVNEALQSLGNMPLVDTTTLTTAGAQTEYAAPVAWKQNRPFRIDIQGRTGDANDNRWVQVNDWDWVPAAGGSTGLIVFGRQPLQGRTIRVWYSDGHPVVNAFSDVINERIDPELMTAAFVFQIRNWQVEQDDGSDQSLKDKWNKAKNEFDQMMAQNPIEEPRRQSKLLITRDMPYRTDQGYYSTDWF